MKRKRYLMIACLLSFPSFFVNVEAPNGGSSSVGIESYQSPRAPAPKDPPPKTNVLAADPKEPAGPPQGDRRSDDSIQITTIGSMLPRIRNKSQANSSILGFVLIGLAGIVHRKKGRHEAN